MAGTEKHQWDVHSVDDPAEHGVAVTPNDGADLSFNSRALWVGGAGAISVRMVGDSADVLLSGIPAGTLLPIRVSRVRATGTTATLIVALA